MPAGRRVDSPLLPGCPSVRGSRHRPERWQGYLPSTLQTHPGAHHHQHLESCSPVPVHPIFNATPRDVRTSVSLFVCSNVKRQRLSHSQHPRRSCTKLLGPLVHGPSEVVCRQHSPHFDIFQTESVNGNRPGGKVLPLRTLCVNATTCRRRTRQRHTHQTKGQCVLHAYISWTVRCRTFPESS